MSQLITLRQARVDDCLVLTQIAIKAKASWGYDESFMDSCKAELTVTPDCLAGDFSTIVAQVDDHPAGFYTLAYSHPGSWSIEALFVSPVMMKKGIGSVLMQDVLQSAVQSKVHTLRIESDPHAVGFYQRFGAVQTGTVASGSIENRCLPLLEIKLPN